MTAEQRVEVEKDVARELKAHGGDTDATLTATIGDAPLEADGKATYRTGALVAWLRYAFPTQGGHEVLHALSPAGQSRDRYTLSHLHAKGGMGRSGWRSTRRWAARSRSKSCAADQAGNAAVCSRFTS